MEHNPIEAAKGVPIWVWLGVVVVVFIAITSHTASQTAAPVSDTSGSNDATSALQQAQLNAQTAIALRVLDISGAEDIANIQARTTEQTNNTALAAINSQLNAAVNAIGAGTSNPVSVTVNKASSSQSFSRQSANATATVRKARMGVLDGAGGALSDLVSFGHGGL